MTTPSRAAKPDADIDDAIRAMDRDPLDTPGLDPLADAIAVVSRDNARWAREQRGVR